MRKLTKAIVLALAFVVGASTCFAQDTRFDRDDFEDGDHQDHDLFNWQKGTWNGGDLFVEDGDLIIEDCRSGGCAIAHQLPSGIFNNYTDVSLRLQANIFDGTGHIVPWGRWTNTRGYYGSVRPFLDEVVVGIAEGNAVEENVREQLEIDDERDVVLKFDLIGDEISLTAWNEGDDRHEMPLVSYVDPRLRNGILGVSMRADSLASIAYRWIEMTEIVPGDVDTNSVIDDADIDYLTNALQQGLQNNRYDVDRDGDVDWDDRTFWVNDVKQTWFGDANLDGEFNSGDLVGVFQSGKYETDGASWAEGDWNGDSHFGTGDLVFAFQDGGFEKGPRVLVNAVPEPTCFAMLLSGLIGVIGLTRAHRPQM